MDEKRRSAVDEFFIKKGRKGGKRFIIEDRVRSPFYQLEECADMK